MRHWTFVLGAAVLTQAALFGVYIDNATYAKNFDAWIQKQASLRHINLGWTNSTSPQQIFSTQVQPIWDAGHVPFVDWMPFPYLTWTNPSPNEDIVNGVYDHYIEGFLDATKAFLSGPDGKWGTADDRRIYVRFALEPNGNWFPWSPNCPPCGGTGQKISQSIDSYLALWRYLTTYVRTTYALDGSHLQWVWGANSDDAVDAGWKLEDFYPGDQYVDWLGVDGYNWGNTLPGHQWQTPEEVFGTAISRLQKLAPSKPVIVGTYGCTSIPNGVQAKDSWLSDSFSFFLQKDVRAFTYFSIDNDHDWAVFASANGTGTWTAGDGTTYNVFAAYEQGVDKNDWILGANNADPRLLSDWAFMWGNASAVTVTSNNNNATSV